MPRPQKQDYNPIMESYINLVQFDSIGEIISHLSDPMIHFVDQLPEDKANFAYAPEKWTIKEVLQHVIDMERVFAYRSLCIARGDTQPLPGTDQNAYYQFQRSARRAFGDIKEEYKAMRYDHNILFRSFDLEAQEARGDVLGYSTTCKSIIYVTFGHMLHHKNVLEDRYGIQE